MIFEELKFITYDMFPFRSDIARVAMEQGEQFNKFMQLCGNIGEGK
jgi:hypothetical protein